VHRLQDSAVESLYQSTQLRSLYGLFCLMMLVITKKFPIIPPSFKVHLHMLYVS